MKTTNPESKQAKNSLSDRKPWVESEERLAILKRLRRIQEDSELINSYRCTTKEFAAELGIHPGTLRTWICQTNLPIPIYRVGRAVRFNLSDVLQYSKSLRK